MALSWSIRRQLLYYVVAAIVGLILIAAGYKIFFTHTPTCSDGIQNGTELGVDCGGSCSLVCKNTARAPGIRWARSFPTDIGIYTAAAYVENPNSGAGARAVRYSFQLFDDKNILVAERDGVTDIPPISTIPIVEPNISVGNRTVARTLFSFADAPKWNIVSAKTPDLRIGNQQLEADGSRLSATLTNNSLEDMGSVTVAAVLFDADGIARGASKTTLKGVMRKSSQPVVFTWPAGVPGIVRAEMTIVPSF
jgi:hypothetical protein